MNCPDCNRSNQEGANFCSYCGRSLSGTKGKLMGYFKRAKHKANTLTQNTKVHISSDLGNFIEKIESNGITVGSRRLGKQKTHEVIRHLSGLRKRISPADFNSVDEYNEWITNLDERLGSDSCIICFQKWSANSQIVVCKYCYQGGHLEHMTSWLNSRNSCPLCLEPLTAKDLLMVENVGH